MRKIRYVIRSKISETKFREILKYFVTDLTAKQIANFTKININTINRILKLLRQKIAKYFEQQAKFAGDIETDESYSGPKRVKGKSGHGAAKKIPVVGLLKRGGKIFTKIVENCDRCTLHKFIQEKVMSDSTVYTDG